MIRAENLTLSRNNKPLLKNLSMEAQPGKITAILGPNGAGKSTLLKCLTRCILPDEGSILLNNKPLRDYCLKSLAQERAVLSQSQHISFPFSVEEIVMMGRSPYRKGSTGAENERIAQLALDKVSLSAFAKRDYTSLSGGEQQRVQLARTLAQIWPEDPCCKNNPGYDCSRRLTNKFLFLDEPTSALDLKHQRLVLQTAKDLAAQSLGVVCILHDMNQVMSYADHVCLIKEGALVAQGAPRAVLTEQRILDVFDIHVHILHRPEPYPPVVVLEDHYPAMIPTTATRQQEFSEYPI